MDYLKLDNLIVDVPNSLEFKTLTFNGGEQHIQIKKGNDTKVTIEVSLVDSNKVMLLFLATDALKRLGYKEINLFAPYLPYARQDRVCNEGEALSIKVLCALINLQDYNKVYILDNHSEVSTALLNNCYELKLVPILKRTMPLGWYGADGKWAIISPDAGSNKKIYKIVKELIPTLYPVDIIECSKVRDVTNGKILKTNVHSDKIYEYSRLLIIDDICDGGRTFIELTKALKSKGAKEVILFVSHGIFSQGIEILLMNQINRVFTTKSFLNNIDTEREGFYESDLY